ncbi:MAG: T9SS type A sorting domain-containing protein [Candidatus Cloacimonas sp.]|jgi:M6 family metalloprotease-like protein|nr:T9SS type A sorting domain-containing protein [Candidatus Cloacimonas sp.]
MKKYKLLLLLCLLTTMLFGQKMLLRKGSQYSQAKKHPYAELLSQTDAISKTRTAKRTDPNFERLLVILVDFPLESPDDTNTTGNGKFALEPDPTYLYSIGSPPHNRNYFETNLEAMKYYYRAVSAESFQLEYDVYPKDKPAYTLPNSMGYYNPAGASGELFVSRMEEYFKASFEIADYDDPDIDFGSYAHYMIIHAGSDWQHDIFSDTPSDIPSFYINVTSGKEAVVDGGAILISHACNVPATISQDFQIDDSDAVAVYSGYGALNSVIAHEFGHSLGMVDLYNVANYRPMVGVFDIMDSGGSGILVDNLPDGSLVLVEGALPTLPGAFSRNLMFGDFYRSKGFLKEFPELDLFSSLNLQSISAKQTGPIYTPHTYKIPLNEKEYILVENRSVDPDSDGGTAVFSALDGRVILYPTPLDDPTNPATYEYDYLLPSFQKADGSAVGGGILVWHINEAIIYDEGQTFSDGSWASNYDSNTINTDFLHRGVSVIEADGLNDLGSNYSRYWTGTPYEYFHARKPILDINGSFVNWAQEAWKPELTAASAPPLFDSYGVAGLFGLKQIGNPSATMSFSLCSGFFTSTQVENFNSPSLITSDVINSGFSAFDLPALHLGDINLLSYTDGAWQDLMGDFHGVYEPYIFPPQKADNNNDGVYELVTVHENIVRFWDFSNVELNSQLITFPDPLNSVPLSIGNNVFVTTESCVYRLHNFVVDLFVDLSGAMRIAGSDDKLVVLGKQYLKCMDINNLQVIEEYILPEAFGSHEPLLYSSPDNEHNIIFLMSDAGNLYRITGGRLERIFVNHSSDLPGQIALSPLGQISPVVFFGIGKRLYAVKADGTLIGGYPITSPDAISTWESPMALHLQNKDLLYYPLENKGYIAVDASAKIVPELSLSYKNSAKQDYLYYHEPTNTLYWYYPDNAGRLYIHSLEFLSQNPILFAGYRNGGSGNMKAPFIDETVSDTNLDLYVYPNPVRGSYYRLHLANASGESQLRIFDISGTLVTSQTIPASGNNPRDVELATGKLSSGVYLISLENNGKYKRLKFAVEK